MQVNCHRVKNISYVVIDDYFTPAELKEILSEVKDLKRLAGDGSPKKTGTGVFLDSLYSDRNRSPFLVASRKIFSEEVVRELIDFDAVFGFLQVSIKDSCLVNYYSSGQVYTAHTDTSKITSVALLGVGNFTGGGFAFPDQDVKIDFKENRIIIFPSCISHSSLPLNGDDDAYRVSVAQFIDYVD